MTEQEKILLIGAATAAATKFYFGKGWVTAALWGLGAIAAYSIVTAKTPAQ